MHTKIGYGMISFCGLRSMFLSGQGRISKLNHSLEDLFWLFVHLTLPDIWFNWILTLHSYANPEKVIKKLHLTYLHIVQFL